MNCLEKENITNNKNGNTIANKNILEQFEVNESDMMLDDGSEVFENNFFYAKNKIKELERMNKLKLSSSVNFNHRFEKCFIMNQLNCK